MKKRIFTIFFLFLTFTYSYSLEQDKTSSSVNPEQDTAHAEALKLRDLALKKLEQSTGSKVEVTFAENGTPKWLDGKLTEKATEDKLQFALNFLKEYKDLLLLKNPNDELKLEEIRTNKEGDTHIYFEQIYQSIPVWRENPISRGVLMVHFSKEGYIYSINGYWGPTPKIKISDYITKEKALKIAKKELKSEKFFFEPGIELIILPWKNQIYLAWQVILHSEDFGPWRYLVDAKTGKILVKSSYGVN